MALMQDSIERLRVPQDVRVVLPAQRHADVPAASHEPAFRLGEREIDALRELLDPLARFRARRVDPEAVPRKAGKDLGGGHCRIESDRFEQHDKAPCNARWMPRAPSVFARVGRK